MKISDLDPLKIASPDLQGPYTVTVKNVVVITTSDDKKYLVVDCGKSSIRLTVRNATKAVSAGLPDDTSEWVGRTIQISSATDQYKNWFWVVKPA